MTAEAADAAKAETWDAAGTACPVEADPEPREPRSDTLPSAGSECPVHAIATRTVRRGSGGLHAEVPSSGLINRRIRQLKGVRPPDGR
jgi:hypothetical protein